MNRIKLSLAALQDLKEKGFKSVIVFHASNPAELNDAPVRRLLASKELVTDERTTQVGFHIPIEDPALVEMCKRENVFIEVP